LIRRKAGVVSSLDEALDEPRAQIWLRPHPGVDLQHGRVAAARIGVAGRPAEHLRPVPGQPLNVLGMSGVGERMIQHRIVEAALVMGGGESQESRVAAGELKQ